MIITLTEIDWIQEGVIKEFWLWYERLKQLKLNSTAKHLGLAYELIRHILISLNVLKPQALQTTTLPTKLCADEKDCCQKSKKPVERKLYSCFWLRALISYLPAFMGSASLLYFSVAFPSVTQESSQHDYCKNTTGISLLDMYQMSTWTKYQNHGIWKYLWCKAFIGSTLINDSLSLFEEILPKLFEVRRMLILVYPASFRPGNYILLHIFGRHQFRQAGL